MYSPFWKRKQSKSLKPGDQVPYVKIQEANKRKDDLAIAEINKQYHNDKSIYTCPIIILKIFALFGDLIKYFTKKDFTLTSSRLHNMLTEGVYPYEPIKSLSITLFPNGQDVTNPIREKYSAAFSCISCPSPLRGKHSIHSLLMSAYPYFFLAIVECNKIDYRYCQTI